MPFKMKKGFSIVCLFVFSIALFSFAKKKQPLPTEVSIQTTMGEIVVMLYDETPLHRDNFIKMVKNHSYDSLLFHRVIQNFMIQGGDPDSKKALPGTMLGNGEMPGGRIPAEFRPNIIHKKGALAAARDMNPEMASSNCQFYIVQGRTFNEQQLQSMSQRRSVPYTEAQINTYKTIGGTPHLDMAYTVFGEVLKGLEVVDKIAAVARDANDRPNTDVRIISMRIIEPKKNKFFKNPAYIVPSSGH
jgi:peptidyl-prolyl cis-trans isomerase B (cyclophilin B)